MSQPNTPGAGNFLPPQYTERLEVVESAMQLLEPAPDAGISVNAQMTECTLKLMGPLGRHALFVRNEAEKLPGNPHATAESREKLFQLHGFLSAYVDINLRLSTDMSATVTGDLEANDPENAPAGYEAGEELIVSRARHTASALLRATDVIYMEYDDAPDSVWARANAAHRSGRTKAGPKIKKRDYEEFNELCRAALDAPIAEMPNMSFKPSRFGAINMFRAMRAAKVELPDGDDTSGLVMLEKGKQMAEISSAGQPTPLELEPSQIAAVMATTTKVLKHVRNASRADTSLQTDPSVRYLSFMLAKLSGGYAIGSEIAAYKRRAEQIAAQLRQFH